MHQLVFINIVIILMDMALLSMECASLYLLETVTKGVCYSIKLKLEFAILSRLVKFVGAAQKGNDVRSRDRSMPFIEEERPSRGTCMDIEDAADFVDMTRIVTDVTHASPPSKSRPSRHDIDLECARFEHVENAKWLS
jgi:hypothetical protein